MSKRKNGYYLYKDFHLPSVSTILKSAGNSEGLVKWAAIQGGLGVMLAVARFKNLEALKSKLGTPAAIEWAREVSQAGLDSERERTASFGSNVHSGVESFLKKVDIDFLNLSEAEACAISTFEDFYAEIGFDPLLIEGEVFSEQLFAGRLDMAVEITPDQATKLSPYLKRNSENAEPGVVIADIKTGSLYIPQQVAQLSAYAVAYQETYGRPVSGGLIIHIPRETPEKIQCYYAPKAELDHAFTKGFLVAFEAWKYFDAPKWWASQWEQKEAA